MFFLKRDFPITFKNSLILSIFYLFLIPIIRGIANLDNVQSAQCLSQSVILIGIIIITPITKRELDTEIKEVIYAKSWSYTKTVCIRFVCALLQTIILISVFIYVMRMNHCKFPVWKFSLATTFYAIFIGILGLVLSQIGKNVIVGYLCALGYWSCCQLQIIKAEGIFYCFPIINGIFEIRNFMMLLFVIMSLLGVFYFALTHSEGNMFCVSFFDSRKNF